MRRWAVAIRVEPSNQAVFGFPGPFRPGRRIRHILHNTGPFDPDERLLTSRGTFGLPLFGDGSSVASVGMAARRTTPQSNRLGYCAPHRRMTPKLQETLPLENQGLRGSLLGGRIIFSQ